MYLSDQILVNKLHAPGVGVKLLERPRLWDILKNYPSRKIILLSAPAGYGKTVLIAQFVKQLSSSTTWYQLDNYDNDFALFIQHLLAGLEPFLPGIVTDMLDQTQKNFNPPHNVRRITTALVNSLRDRLKGELLMTIDDYHVIEENTVHLFMEQLLHYLPDNVHVFLNSRVRPPINLERLRIAGLMEEIDMEKLRFTREEIAGFLKKEYKEPVSSETVTFLEEKTWGWPAALRLAGMAMAASGTSHKPDARGVLPNSKEIYQYLTAEVMGHIPGTLAEFALSTSVLDIMTPELCDVFGERSDSKQVLEEMESRYMFVTALEGKYQAFRYHPLFREFLQNKHTEKQKKTLFQKGGHSYRQVGYLSQAIECFLKAGDYAEALSVVEKYSSKMLLYNRWHTINRWLEGIPASLKKARPRILLLESVICLKRGKLNQAEALIDAAALIPSDPGDWEVKCQVRLCQARTLRSRGKYEQSIALLEQILPELSLLPIAEWYDVTLEHSLILLMQGEFAKASHLLNPAFAKAEHERELHITAWLAERLGMLYYFMGDYDRAVEIKRQVAEMAPEQDQFSFSLWDSMAAISYDWGELQQALEYAQNSIKVKERLVLMEALPYAYSQLAVILAGLNEPAAAEKEFLHSIRMAKTMEGEKFFLALSMAFYSHFLTEQGRIEEALTVGEEAIELSGCQSSFIYAVCTEMTAPAYIKGGKLSAGADMLENALEILEEIGARYFTFYARAFLAALYRQQDNYPEAEKQARSCLELAAFGNYRQFFLSHQEMMVPVVKTGLVRGCELDFIFEIIRQWGEGAEQLLLEISIHEDHRVRERVVRALKYIKGTGMVRVLDNLLNDPCEEVREKALTVRQKACEQGLPGIDYLNADHPDEPDNLPDDLTYSLKLQCLGPFRLLIDNQEAVWRTTKAREILAYLFHYRGKHVLKDKILEDIWPNFAPERASALFHTNLYQLRRVLKTTPGEQPIMHKDKKYFLNQREFSSDIDNFLALTGDTEEKGAIQPVAAAKLERAVSLYRGDYMEDLDYHWVEAEREQLKQVYLTLLERLAHGYTERGDLDQAASCLRTVLSCNPLLEDTHVFLMKIYARMGDRMAVMQQYQNLSRVLEQELGINPALKTKEIYYRLCSE